MNEFCREFDQTGRIWFRSALCPPDIENLLEALSCQDKPGQRIGMSSDLKFLLGQESKIGRLLRNIRENPRPVRGVFFNKTQENNWGVPWHQDRVIAVRDKIDIDGFSNWSQKAGTWHCEAPESILDEMLFVRVHLDDTNNDNGAMEIALGSHKRGVIKSDQIDEVVRHCDTEICEAGCGDILVLKMLTLHRSSPARQVSSRRVLRIDYAFEDLPAPLKWTG